MKRTWKRIGSLLLTVCMVVTMLPTVAFAETGDVDSGVPLGTIKTITAFAALEAKTVETGTLEDELKLPDMLAVTLTEGDDTATGSDATKEPETTVAVSGWTSDPAYDGNTAGDYVFTPTLALPEGLTLAAGVELPNLTVTVQEESAAPQARGGMVPMGEAGVTIDITGKSVDAIKTEIDTALEGVTSGDTVTVTGTVTFDKALILAIPAGVTVDWRAEVTGALDGTPVIAVTNSGTGTFIVSSGGSITNTHPTQGGGIRNESSGEVRVAGGTVQSSAGSTIFNASTGIVSVLDGMVRNTGFGTAIHNAEAGKVTVSGGTVENIGTGIGIHNYYNGTVTVSGESTLIASSATTGTIYQSNNGSDRTTIFIEDGRVQNNSTGAAVSNHARSTISISGGTLVSSSGNAVYNSTTYSGAIHVSGGTFMGGIALATQPTNGTAPVYHTTLTGLPSSKGVTALTSPAGYGVTGVSTDTDGKLYFYLPEGAVTISLTVDGSVYTGAGTVSADNTATIAMEPAATEITGFAEITSLIAGAAGNATYANAEAVIAALPTSVTANYVGSTVSWLVTTWVDTDGYSPAAAGSYTFTATLDTAPAGYANSGGHTATVEVVVSEPELFILDTLVTDANKDNITGPSISGSVSYDPATKTLTLNNATISPWSDRSTAYLGTGILAEDDLTVKLIGQNRIGAAPNNPANEGDYNVEDGIESLKSLSITGEGSLTVYDRHTGISGVTSLTVDIGGRLLVTEYGDEGRACTLRTDGALTIKRGILDLTSYNSKGLKGNSIVIEGGIISAQTEGTDGEHFAFNVLPTFSGGYAPSIFAGESAATAVEVPSPTAATFTASKYVRIQPPDLETYTITLNANGGSVSPATMQTDAVGTLTILPIPTRSGSYSFDGWFTAASGGTKVTASTVFPANSTIYAHWTDTSGGGSGGDSGGGSSSSGSTPPATVTSSNVDFTGAVNQTAITDEAAAALSGAASGGTAVVRTQNASSITPAVLSALANAAQGKNIVLHADTMSGNAVQGRIYVDPAKLADVKEPIKLGIYTESAKTTATTAIFEKFFGNNVATVSFEQQGSLGARLEVAAKVDLADMDVTKLVLYSYDRASNTYRRIENPAYWVDKNGYLHFTTALAGDIIISEGPLTLKNGGAK